MQCKISLFSILAPLVHVLIGLLRVLGATEMPSAVSLSLDSPSYSEHHSSTGLYLLVLSNQRLGVPAVSSLILRYT